MSIKILSLGTIGIKERIGSYIREHGSEMAIAGIMTTILVGTAAAALQGTACTHSQIAIIIRERIIRVR